MVQQLLRNCFKQLKNETEITSKTGLCKFLADRLTDDFDYSVSYRTLERLYNGYILESGKQPEVKQKLLDKLAEYQGFLNYADYVSRNKKQRADTTPEGKSALNLTAYTLIGIILIALVGYPIYREFDRTDCMIWINDHYEKAECKGGASEKYNEQRFENMKKLDVDCSTEFFNASGEAVIYYDKINSDTVIFYSFYGPSPESRDDLKPVTDYMIDKYVDCD